MYSKESSFFQKSIQIAEEFLQTAIIVDDQAYFDIQKNNSPVELGEIKKPGRRSISQEQQTDIPYNKNYRNSPTQILGAHTLDAQKVINSFAQKRIVCSVIKPSKDTDWQTSVENLSNCADLIILDWDLDNDNGEKTLYLLEKILRSAGTAPAQLKLVVIYTGEPGIQKIALQIKKLIITKLKVSIGQIKEQDLGLAFSYSSTRVVVFSKPGTMNVPSQFSDYIIDFEKLADKVTKEFAMLTAGLVSNVAISSLAIIRQNTNKILHNFSTLFDAPYLAHRAMQESPQEAEELLLNLIVEEIRAILEEESVGDKANIDVIKDWLTSIHPNGLKLNFSPPIDFSIDDAIEMLTNGQRNCTKISATKRENPHKIPFTEMFLHPQTNCQNLNENFSYLTTFRKHYNKTPKLTFGTIVQQNVSKDYFVCLQPRCDSIRIKDDKPFPFLPLPIVRNENDGFKLVLSTENSSYIRVAIKDKLEFLQLFTFKPDDKKNIIYAKKSGKNFYFSDKNSKKFIWIGELRSEQIQRLANEFAANISRVGLDESEWLRRWALKR